MVSSVARAASPCPDISPRCRIDNALAKYRKKGVISGTLLVHRRDRNLDWELGQADFGRNIPNQLGTRFLIASCSKSFVAAAVLKLADEGKLRLDDKLSTYLDEYEPAKRITIAQVLSHTAGVPEAYDQPPIESRIDRQPLAFSDFLAAIKNQPLSFTPGTRFEYSNTGYVLLGEVVRRASRESYAGYLRREFFTPLGLTATSIGSPTDATPARPFQLKGKRHVDIRDRDGLLPIADSEVFADTDVYTDARDLAAWTEKMTGGAVLSPAATTAMLTPGKNGYGFGWIVYRDDQNRVAFEHAGSYRGYQSWMRRYPAEEIVLTWLGNQKMRDDDVASLIEDVAEAALGSDWTRP